MSFMFIFELDGVPVLMSGILFVRLTGSKCAC